MTDYDDLCKRLQQTSGKFSGSWPWELCLQAKAAIAALREQVEQTKEAARQLFQQLQKAEAENAARRTRILRFAEMLTVADSKIAELEAENAALREQVEAFRREQIARSKIDPVTRLHNLCDGLAESRHESPYDQASWDLADADNKQLRARAERAEAERDALRKMVNAADEMRLCLHKPIKNYADDLLDAIVAYDHARLESDAALLAGKEGK